MDNLKDIIDKLLKEVDEDIAEIMTRSATGSILYWELLNSPALTIIEWQRMRNDKKEFSFYSNLDCPECGKKIGTCDCRQ